jgi:hypothetical protein
MPDHLRHACLSGDFVAFWRSGGEPVACLGV